jgi:hypothetical protein
MLSMQPRLFVLHPSPASTSVCNAEEDVGKTLHGVEML